MSFLSMGKNVARNLFEGPATRRYPKEKREYGPGSRGMIGIDIEACIFCGLCSRRCPTGALTVRKDPREWEIDRLRCIFCGYCVEVCPKKCLAMANHYSPGVTVREDAVHMERQAPRPAKEAPPEAKE
ncbi:MAG: 4Fe-4S dicluster domain-containing protein [Spirochaetes bacterium]|mgnify:FL=1|nr:4Fe-4S dicluster domain-containing protein [Spirochaetota bacterium]